MSQSSTPSPSVSVVIPVRNEADAIGHALAAIAAQDYAGPIEVVVADGMSTDGTREVLASASDVIAVDNPAGSTPAGLNAAIRAASGSVIVRCDAHSVFAPDYVRRVVELLDETGADNVGGVQRAVGESLFQRAVALAMSSPVGVGDAKFHYGGQAGPTDTVYLGSFPKAVFDRVGMFDESLARNQDYELNIRIRRAGGTVYFHPDLEVVYRPRASLRALWRQYFEYGTWKRHVVTRYPDSLRARQLAAPLLIVGLAASAGAALVGWWRVALVVPAAWVLVLVAGTAHAWRRHRNTPALLMGIAAAAMHLSWGLGFLFGRTRSSGTDQDSSRAS